MDERIPLQQPIMPGAERTAAPADLTAPEKILWATYMEAMPAGWFSRETLPLLRLLCRYAAMSEAALNVLTDPMATDSLGGRELQHQATLCQRAATMVVKLSVQLQLTPRSRSEYGYLSRKKDGTSGRVISNRPWEIPAEDEEGDDARSH
jgi:hypothetical protein